MKPYFITNLGSLYQGDALEVLKSMTDESVQCCVTSPPYWGLRDYGVSGQLGLEKTPEEYVSKMVEVFREVKRVFRKDGTLWLNLGDSYTAGDMGNGMKECKQQTNKGSCGFDIKKPPPWMKPKNLVGIPWRVAFALQADGWYLRQDIIWHKPNPMPESVKDRCCKSHEYIFLMSKSARYYYDNEAIKEDVSKNTHNRISHSEIERIKKERAAGANTSVGMGKTPKSVKPDGMIKQNHSFENAVCLPVDKRNKRSVWTVSTKPFSGAHSATFPPALILPCILAGTSEKGCCVECGAPWERVVDYKANYEKREPAHAPNSCPTKIDSTGWKPPTIKQKGWQPTCKCETEPMPDLKPCTILDPFAGSGTIWSVCEKHNRKSVNIELSGEYCNLIKTRITNETRQLKLF